MYFNGFVPRVILESNFLFRASCSSVFPTVIRKFDFKTSISKLILFKTDFVNMFLQHAEKVAIFPLHSGVFRVFHGH